MQVKCFQAHLFKRLSSVFSWLNHLCSFVKDQLTIVVWVCFWAFSSVPLNYVSTLVLIPCCLDYGRFMVRFEAWCCQSSKFVFFFFFSALCWLFWVFCFYVFRVHTFKFFSIYFFSLRKIALQSCIRFCHTMTWISHNYTHIPFLSSLFPLPIAHLSRSPQNASMCSLGYIATSHQLCISHMIIYI